MKKLILLLIIPFFNFGQGCHYGSSVDASEICDFYRGNNFATYRNADIALDKILDVTGMSKRFVLKECHDISNCVATAYKGIRYILYDKNFMDAIASNTNSWSNMSILAHEVGHHVNGHSLDLIVYASGGADAPTPAESRQMELEADEYSGFIMYKLGASLAQSQEAIRLIATDGDDSYSTHPARHKRLAAIERGYNRAKNQSSNNSISISSSKTNLNTAEDYFYKAYNTKCEETDKLGNQYKVDNLTKCLELDPDYGPWAYNNRAIAYHNLGRFYDAIDDYNKAIRIDRNYESAYYGRAIVYKDLEQYYNAIDDYTKAIRIDPNYRNAYYGRGIVYKILEKYHDAIDDYNKVIKIDPDYVRVYVARGNVYYSLGEYRDAISDYNKAIRKDRNYSLGYYNRGNAYKVLEQYYNAIDDYSKVIRIDPNYKFAYYQRGHSYTKLERYRDAIDDYNKAIKIDPNYARAYNARGTAKWYLKSGNYCSDYKIGCQKGSKTACDNYSKFCD